MLSREVSMRETTNSY